MNIMTISHDLFRKEENSTNQMKITINPKGSKKTSVAESTANGKY